MVELIGKQWRCTITIHDRVARTESGHLGFASNLCERLWCNDHLLGLLR